MEILTRFSFSLKTELLPTNLHALGGSTDPVMGEAKCQIVMIVPTDLVPAIRQLLERNQATS